MEQILQNIDWFALLSAVWTIILVPIGKQIYDWFESKRLDAYAVILYEEVVKAVKALNQSIVDDIKGTEIWTDDKKQEIRDLCKTKAIQALSFIAYRSLKEANEDFEAYLDGLIDTALYDVKNGLK